MPALTNYQGASSATAGNPGSGFDYWAAFGSNPWIEPTQQISGLLSELAKSLRGSALAGGGASSLGTHVAAPTDPEVQSYMAHLLGGQRNMLADYVRRAAGAGIKRGGLNVRGGPALDSSLHHMAMQSLASGYEDRFQDAMNYNKYLKDALYSQYTDRMRNLEDLLGTQHRYLTSQADWRTRLGELQHGDWQSELDWSRQTPFRQLELERARLSLDQERWRNLMEQQDRAREIDTLTALENTWRQLKAKAESPYGTPWTAGDHLALERAMVQLGIWSPLSRQMKAQPIRSGGSSSQSKDIVDF
jgi:hypothetical protein